LLIFASKNTFSLKNPKMLRPKVRENLWIWPKKFCESQSWFYKYAKTEKDNLTWVESGLFRRWKFSTFLLLSHFQLKINCFLMFVKFMFTTHCVEEPKNTKDLWKKLPTCLPFIISLLLRDDFQTLLHSNWSVFSLETVWTHTRLRIWWLS
jgi:hypothetical protein